MIDRRLNTDNVTLTNDSVQEFPDDEPEKTGAEWMDECVHCSACLRVLGMLAFGGEVDTNRMCWQDDCARILGCADCTEWDG